MEGENSTGNNLIWAITILLIVAIIAGALYYGGALNRNSKEKIDVEIKVPTTSNSN